LPADPGPIFEAHSTDYQPDEALAALVRARFAILKVGPELTFAWREALVALDQIEAHLIVPDARANVVAAVRAEMLADPADWKDHYSPGGSMAPETALLFGLSDRIRYYWSRLSVALPVTQLLEGLPEGRIPRPLLRQYLPALDASLNPADPSPSAEVILARAVEAVADRYWRACRMGEGQRAWLSEPFAIL
jgi:D-tagatose-1,6-bisphosphate aldolase subunit GatZ/KbaZ